MQKSTSNETDARFAFCILNPAFRTKTARLASNRRLRAAALIVVCLALAGATASAQDPAASSAAVRIFIDCNNVPCDTDFFRTELSFVEHVRDRQNADVHLLMTGQSTGSGGREITFSFFGQGRFKGQDRVLKETFVVAASQDAVRRGMVRVMSLGLVPYTLGTSSADRLRVTVQPATATTAAGNQPATDPWNRKPTANPRPPATTRLHISTAVSASARPVRKATRGIGSDRSRSTMPLSMSAVSPTATMKEAKAMVCAMIPAISHSR